MRGVICLALAAFSAIAIHPVLAQQSQGGVKQPEQALPLTLPENDPSHVGQANDKLVRAAAAKLRRAASTKIENKIVETAGGAAVATLAAPPITETRKATTPPVVKPAEKSDDKEAQTPIDGEVISRRVLPFQVNYIFNRDIGRGRLQKVQDGRDGEEVTVRVTTQVNGKPVTREEKRVTRKPQNEVFHMGTSGFTGSSRGSYTRARVLEMEATAYTPDAGRKNPTFKTRTGRRAQYGVVAVDPRVIPLNSLVYVEGYGFAIAADTGGAIKGNIIDVCVEDKATMRTWGRRKVKVHVFTGLHTKDTPRAGMDNSDVQVRDFRHLSPTSRGAVSRRSVGRVNVNQPYQATEAQRRAQRNQQQSQSGQAKSSGNTGSKKSNKTSDKS